MYTISMPRCIPSVCPHSSLWVNCQPHGDWRVPKKPSCLARWALAPDLLADKACATKTPASTQDPLDPQAYECTTAVLSQLSKQPLRRGIQSRYKLWKGEKKNIGSGGQLKKICLVTQTDGRRIIKGLIISSKIKSAVLRPKLSNYPHKRTTKKKIYIERHWKNNCAFLWKCYILNVLIAR